MVKVEPGKDYENQRIVGFVKTNGEEVDLPKGTPRIIKKNVIEMQGQYEIRLDDIRSVERQSDKDGVDRIWKIIARDGRIFFPKSLIIKKETYAFATNEPISIPLSEIKILNMVKTSGAAIMAIIVLVPLAILFDSLRIRLGSSF